MTAGTDPDDRRGPFLTALARGAIQQQLGLAEPSGAAFPPEADERRGAFVTLRVKATGDLRGCIGLVEPREPLREAVRRAAIGAAFHDPRFPPVQPRELPALAIDVSVLGPLQPSAPEAVVVGRHGVLVRKGARSGLLLPQVAVEQGWDRETLLEQACRKAGLPQDSWSEPGCALFVFETTSYSESG